MILLDTNIFLELLLDRKGASDCEHLLSTISTGKIEAVTTHFTVHAIEVLLRIEERVMPFLRNLENSKGLYVYDTGISEEIAASILSKRLKRDFDDTIQYYTAKRLGAEAIVSYDKHFDGLDIPRVEPPQILRETSKG